VTVAPATGFADCVLRLTDLCVGFRSAGGIVPAVRGVTFGVHAGQCVAVVGESGSGKSVTSMSVTRLVPAPPAVYERGSIVLRTRAGEVDTLRANAQQIRAIRGREAAMIFQEPMTSLNPVMTIGEQIAECFTLHENLRGSAALDAAAGALRAVGIEDAARRLRSYPHEFSGGMRQRVMIAMALACGPRVLLADEPTTALDATTRGGVLELVDSQRRERGLAVLFITHDLHQASRWSHAVCVMYGGRVVEFGPSAEVLREPLHPYTAALIECVPRPGDAGRRLTTVADLSGDASTWDRLSARAREVLPRARAWWPGAGGPDADREPRLVRATPARWVLVASSEETQTLATPPAHLPPASSV
jgi:ABC-type dipeptide/oligopeptide/nickel transport system ATPase component